MIGRHMNYSANFVFIFDYPSFKFLSVEGIKKLVPQIPLNTFISLFDHGR